MEVSATEPETQAPSARNPAPWRAVFRRARIPTLIATWFGTGFLPIAPGTWGSLAAIPFAHFFHRILGLPGLIAFAVAASIIGVHAAQVTARLRGVVDPSEVVVDEVAGQTIALVPVYALLPGASGVLFWGAVAASFFLFRVLDVLKPGPIRRLEALPGGFGIMCDDLLAGACVALLLWGALALLR